ncbi:TatD family hydrolase [Ilumatobacter sp.]|uniref:TatD family hydrolase n=1 Tax=Ilumatobacter sp. TaxID=1967498 RepID=UPI003B515AF8
MSDPAVGTGTGTSPGDDATPPALSWIDSHCHVHDERIPDGADGAVEAAREQGVGVLVTVGCDRATSLAAIDLAARHDGVFATVGLHPHEARHGIDTIVDLLDTPGIVAIGEAGLDHFYEHSPRAEQRQVFAQHIALAHEHRLPLIIHTRDAWEETFEILDAEGVPERTVFHCFTGGPGEAERGLERDIRLSFSGIVTFPSASEVQEAARMCPSTHLLVETDSPYLAPVPHRGRTNRPAWVPDVGRFLAELRGEPIERFAAATVAATRDAFDGRLDP